MRAASVRSACLQFETNVGEEEVDLKFNRLDDPLLQYPAKSRVLDEEIENDNASISSLLPTVGRWVASPGVFFSLHDPSSDNGRVSSSDFLERYRSKNAMLKSFAICFVQRTSFDNFLTSAAACHALLLFQGVSLLPARCASLKCESTFVSRCECLAGTATVNLKRWGVREEI